MPCSRSAKAEQQAWGASPDDSNSEKGVSAKWRRIHEPVRSERMGTPLPIARWALDAKPLAASNDPQLVRVSVARAKAERRLTGTDVESIALRMPG
jgi:hypothetical protein